MSETPVIHWFRRDLRLRDNTALQAALNSGHPVLPLFILDPAILKSPRTGAPRLRFMLQALHALDQSLREHGTRLLVQHGSPAEIIPALTQETGAAALCFNRDYTPFARRRDSALHERLSIPIHACDDTAILPPGAVLKDDDEPYTVYTPFMRRWKTIDKLTVTPFTPGRFHTLAGAAYTPIPDMEALGFEETIAVPTASEQAAQRRLHDFTSQPIYAYAQRRNALIADPFGTDGMATSCLSPWLRFGLISARAAYWSAREAYQTAPDEDGRKSVETWVNELIWRDFYIHIMYHFAYVDKRSFRPEYDALAWDNDPELLQAWQDGMTGYPVVDAAMRQLKAVGWMPNRARMIVASFLTKDLLIDWREGERHFMQWLIDGDPAANNGGWQWAAGTGTDAQPYFRIFNPVSQSQQFDPDGGYIRRWLPELRDVPAEHIHAPWEMPDPPPGYPAPVIDHAQARERTIAAYKAVKSFELGEKES